MNPLSARRFITGGTILLALATTGCLTSGVLYEARRPNVHHRTITGVTGAAVSKDRLVIGLTVLRDGMARPERLSVEIPLSDLDWARKNAVQGTPEVPGFLSARPPKKALRKSSTALKRGSRIEIESVELARLEDLMTLREHLPPGIHVLALQQTARPGHAGTVIPAFLDTREGREPYGVVISELPDARTHRKFLVLLLPLTVPIDAVTFPLQLVAVIVGGGC